MHGLMVIKGSLVTDSAHAVTGSTPVVNVTGRQKKTGGQTKHQTAYAKSWKAKNEYMYCCTVYSVQLTVQSVHCTVYTLNSFNFRSNF